MPLLRRLLIKGGYLQGYGALVGPTLPPAKPSCSGVFSSPLLPLLHGEGGKCSPSPSPPWRALWPLPSLCEFQSRGPLIFLRTISLSVYALSTLFGSFSTDAGRQKLCVLGIHLPASPSQAPSPLYSFFTFGFMAGPLSINSHFRLDLIYPPQVSGAGRILAVHPPYEHGRVELGYLAGHAKRASHITQSKPSGPPLQVAPS
jgi:hypothetical protein